MTPSWIAWLPVSCLLLACGTSGVAASNGLTRDKRRDATETVKCTGSDDTFSCDAKNNQCVKKIRTCNGIPDCDNGHDESVETCGCLPHEFQCNNTHCIDLLKRCDISLDCQNGSDEDDCETYECPASHAKCHNHKCIPRDKMCDFVDDCGDGSDELKEHCKPRPCQWGEFKCDNNECTLDSRLCDGVKNCKDGSDEIQERCNTYFRCPTGFYVSTKTKCDGWFECKITHMDEADCGECSSDQYKCSNGQCVSVSDLCDGTCDCSDCLDEASCGSKIYCNNATHFVCPKTYRCIARSRLCDGHNDCRDFNIGSDEYFCYNKTSDCSSFSALYGRPAIRCDGRCLPRDHNRCNKFADCEDGIDEEGCEFPQCSNESFECDNHLCIPAAHRCDGKNQCHDWSDERGCEYEDCPSGKVRCHSGQCIPDYKWCNHWPNCPDGSDEDDCDYKSCTQDEFQCLNGECIPKALACYNGKKADRDGCDDQSHLIDCASQECGEGQFKCLHSFCVDQEQKCDNKLDCILNMWDEHQCIYPCPNKDRECKCDDRSMNCEGLGLTKVPFTHKVDRINELHLADNRLGPTLKTFTFAYNDSHLDIVTSLDLSVNGMKMIPQDIFTPFWRLRYLNLANNSISKIHNSSFTGLKNLLQLYLQGNDIEELAPYAFIDMGELPTLDLSQQKLSNVEVNTFQGLRSLRMLNLSGNRLTFLRSGAFNGLEGLLTLDISKNHFALIEKHVFSSLPSLDLLLTDEFRFCCMARDVSKCYPEGDEFSSCEDLMSNIVLRVCIWVLGLVASLGNVLVIVWRARTVRGSKVHSFLITNLAIGDLLMGIYLMIIAGVDYYYRGIYILHAADWKSSVLCRMAGFFSMFSSELSVLTLTVITLDRLCCIIFPLRVKRLGVKEAVIVMGLVWLLVFAIAYIPVSGIDYFGNFYGRSGVCLALPVTPAQPPGWEYSVAVFLVLNFMSFVVIALAYVWMFLVAKETRSAVRSGETKTDTAMARRMSLIVMTDFTCWVPIILLGFASMAGAHASNQVYAWIAVFILPINSAINPILYTLSTAPFKGTVQKRARHFRKSFMTSMTADTKNSFVDDRTVHSFTDRRSSPRQGETMRMKTMRVTAPGYSGKTSSDI